jgi:hypothetical protein
MSCNRFLRKGIQKLEALLLNKDDILSLIPKDDIAEDDEYIVRLQKVLANRNKVKNVAISGPYGSGKTSILHSFKKHHPEYNYLDISLAYFTDEEEDKNGNTLNKPISTEQIESCILKQLLHRVDKGSLPDSRFDRIKHLSRKKIFSYVIGILIWVWSILAIYYPTSLSKLNVIKYSWWTEFLVNFNVIISVIEFTVFLIGTSAFVWKAIRYLNRMTLKKVNINGKVEISNENDNSILNKHLDEIIYFFYKTKFDVVIFEDLDRFNNISIFAKLREINFLINQAAPIKHEIVFIYALKDDLFVNGERTKFFDYIIPVIPIVNSSNSENLFLEYFKNHKEIELDEEFKHLISDISLYVKEMRVLNNILNEFDIFTIKLNRKELKPCKLFALVVYKNVFPDDFAKLYIDESKLNLLIRKKKDWIISVKKNKLEKVDQYEKLIDDKNELGQKRIKELRMLYLGKFYELISARNRPLISFYIDGLDISKSEILNDENFTRFQNQTNIHYRFNTSYNNQVDNTRVSFKDIEEEVDSEQTYLEKENLISVDVEDFNRKISNLKSKINELDQWTLSEILTDDLVGNAIEEVKVPKLLKYLIRNEFIDESYTSYISLFHSGSFVKADSDYILSVKEEQPKPFNYEIFDFNGIVNKIWSRQFLYPAVLNVGLVDHFIESSYNNYKDKFDNLLKVISNGSTNSFKFIDYYIDNGKYPGELLKYLCSKTEKLWDRILVRKEFSKEKRDKCFELLLRNCTTKELTLQNKEGSVRKYIEDSPDFLNYYEKINFRQEVMDLIMEIGVKFKHLTPHDGDGNVLFNFIDKYCLYELNIEMLSYILSVYGKYTPEFNSANYTCIKESGAEKLIEYVDANYDSYIENIHKNIEESTNEKLEFIEDFLQSGLLSEDNELYVIKKCNFKCILLNMPDNLWSKLIANNKVEAAWENIITITTKHKIYHKPIIKFLNDIKNQKSLIGSIPSDLTEEHKTLFIKILVANHLDNEVHRIYAENLNVKIDEEEKDTINIEKAYSLISNDRFEYSFDLYDGFKSGYKSDVHIKYLIKVIDEFLDDEERFELDKYDYILMLKLLTSQDIIKRFIEIIPDSEINRSFELSDLIIDFYLLTKTTSVSYDRFFCLAENLGENRKVLQLFINTSKNFDMLQTSKLLQKLPPPWNTLLMNRQVKLKKEELNISMLATLTEKEFVSTVRAKENDEIVAYIKIGNAKKYL